MAPCSSVKDVLREIEFRAAFFGEILSGGALTWICNIGLCISVMVKARFPVLA
jgi:hypothetical protein